jgi:hypothetical protein
VFERLLRDHLAALDGGEEIQVRIGFGSFGHRERCELR